MYTLYKLLEVASDLGGGFAILTLILWLYGKFCAKKSGYDYTIQKFAFEFFGGSREEQYFFVFKWIYIVALIATIVLFFFTDETSNIIFNSIKTVSLVFSLTSCNITFSDNSRSAKLKELVAYSIGESSNKFRYGIDLVSHIAEAQKKFNIPTECLIREKDEWDTVKTIITLYQKYLLDRHLSGDLYIPNTKYKLSGEDFFMYWLCTFIEQNLTEHYVGEHEMRGRKLKQYGDYYSCSDTVYEMTDFCVVFFKLLLITYYYQKDSKVLRANTAIDIEIIKEQIVSKTITISRR